MEIKEYEEKYAKGMSEIIRDNLYTINIKDYGKEVIDKIARHFTEEEIKKNFPERVKCFVALKDEKVIGTASLDIIKDMYGVKVENHKDKYIILTVFIKIENQHQGVRKKLIEEIEKYASEIGAKELIIPAPIYGCEFYKKMGYDFYNGIKEINKNGEYVLSKKIIKESE